MRTQDDIAPCKVDGVFITMPTNHLAAENFRPKVLICGNLVQVDFLVDSKFSPSKGYVRITPWVDSGNELISDWTTISCSYRNDVWRKQLILLCTNDDRLLIFIH